MGKQEVRYLKPVAKTPNHREYHRLLRDMDKKIVMVQGYPGSGKSISAVYYGCRAMLDCKVKGLIFIRPNDGVGKEIGFLPGNEYEKMSPKLKQLIQYAESFTGMDCQLMIQTGKIVIQTLYNLQGMDLTGYYLIVDESQNIDPQSMFCILTRGADKIVFTGDCHPSQCVNKQLKPGRDGLSFLFENIGDLDCVGIVNMDSPDDIVRCDYMKDVILRMVEKLG